MEVLTTSMFVILLIFGLGLSGASYNTCQNTLQSNGYNLTDSQYQSFYEAANDPDNIHYINTHSDSLAESWASISSGEISLTDWYNNYLVEAGGNESGSITPTDSQWKDTAEDTESVTVWDDDLRANAVYSHFGKNAKVIEDGHGGYYISVIEGDSTGANIGYYSLYHYDANGNCYKQFSGAIPHLATTDDNSAYGVLEIYYDYYVVENEDGSQTVTVTCTKKQKHPSLGEVVNFTDYDHTYRFPTDRTGEIVEKKTDSTTDIVVNPDGSITLPDGTIVYPNSDGTYTINGTDYSPSKTVPGINDLLKQLLDLQDKVADLENELQLEKEKEEANEAISEAVDEAASSYSGDLSEFLLNSRITQIFPFCLPFDFVRGLKLFSTSPVPPKFDIDFDIPAFGAYPGTHDVITLDFSIYSKYFTVVRWVTTILFIISLTFITYKLIKW